MGRVFVEADSLSEYFEHVATFAAFLENGQLGDTITGCYMNRIPRPYGRTFRLTYFTRRPSDARSKIFRFAGDRLLPIAEENKPDEENIALEYGGIKLERAFRSYLSTYSWIGVDLLNSDRQYARRLCAVFRWRVFPAGTSYREYFRPSFQNRSQAYRSLSTTAKAAFWENLARWPDPFQTDWAHMLVNMVVGHDWGNPPVTFAQKPPARNPLIDKRCDTIQIPQSWSPD